VWQTFFHIPHERFGVPVFGVGWALAIFVIASGVYLALQIRRHGVDREVWGYLPVFLLISLALVFVLPQLEEVHDGQPIGIPIRGYGVMMLCGILAAVWLTVHRGGRLGIDPELIFSLAFYAFICGILGARLFFILQYWQEIQQESLAGTFSAMMNVTQGGLVVYGSLIGGATGVALFAWRRQVPLLPLCDLVAPSVLLGMAIGRIGCLMNGCCFGGECDLPWAIHFPPASAAYERQVYDGTLLGVSFEQDTMGGGVIREIEPGSPAEAFGLQPGQKIREIHFPQEGRSDRTGCGRSPENQASAIDPQVLVTLEDDVPLIVKLPSHSRDLQPTQIYSSFNAFLLCVLLLACYPFRRRDGELSALCLTLYPMTRFLLEIIRSDEPGQFGTGLTISQLVSLAILAIAAALWVYVLRQPEGTIWPTEREGTAESHPGPPGESTS
jgi:phosphatidylglycerol:prolipoprotein diacylglycerol transferase